MITMVAMGQAALSIKLRCASWQQLATIYRRDLKRGTMFLKSANPPPIGTSIRIDLTLPSGSVIGLHGAVEHHVKDPARGHGVDLKLEPIAAGSIWLIESALESEQRRSNTSPQVTQTPTVPFPTTGGLGERDDLAAAEDDLLRALVAEAESLKKLNPFLVLGIGYEATDADVRAAFGELTKRYHPDRFARYESPELRQLAAEIFILIRDAYRRLGDADGRAQVVASLGRAPAPRAIPAPRAASVVSPLPRPGSVVSPLPQPPRSALGARARPITARPPQHVPIVRVPTPQPGPPASAVRPAEPSAMQTPTPPPPPAPPAAARADTEQSEAARLEDLVEAGNVNEALAAYRILAKAHPQVRAYRAGIELCEGLRALGDRDRLEAAQRFEAALEIDPSNERAARELADMRRQATNERKGLLTRLMGKKEP